MKVVIAPDSFKESLSAQQVCQAIARGVRRACSDAVIEMIPMADGGEGTVEAMVAATGGTISNATVTGPTGSPVVAHWGMLGDGSGTAILEMASASGLALVPAHRRDPTLTTTYGTGELILTAIKAGASRIVIGIGGSATNDGGGGAAQAVGVRFYDRESKLCASGMGGAGLSDVSRIDVSGRDPRIASTPMRVACDVDNPLCGPRGAAAIYGPQKGATPEQITRLDRNLRHLADLIDHDLGKQVVDLPGAGAAGGLGAGLVAFFEAKMVPGVQIVLEAVRFADRIADADLIITGEGRIDQQSMMGKVIEGVGRMGKAAGVPVVALVGSVGEGAEVTLEVLDRYLRITPTGTPIAEALARTGEALQSTTVQVMQKHFRLH